MRAKIRKIMFKYTDAQRNMAIAVKSGFDPSLEYHIAEILAKNVRSGDILIPPRSKP